MISEKATYRLQYWVCWSGPIMAVTYIYFWAICGHNLPPPSHGWSGQELWDNYYVKYRSDILMGMCMNAWLGLIYVIWSVLLGVQMWRRERVPILSLIQILGGALTGWLLGHCAAHWVWCARWAGTVGIDPEMTKEVHFIAWYIYDMTWLVTSMQVWSLGIFGLLDKEKPSLYPRWVSWLSIAAGVSWIPLTVLPYFDEGPLAVNGWFNFGIVFGMWGLWFISKSYYMFQEVKRTRISAAPGIGQAVSQYSAE